jgi:hypothetical protein
MRQSSVLTVLAVVVGLAACSNAPAEPNSDPQTSVAVVRLDEEFDLRAGQTANVGGNALTIAFRRVSGDSRCPMDAVCVWMGDAVVQLDVTVGRAAWTPTELHTHLEPKRTSFREYSIDLVSLLPYPKSDQTIKAEDYVARLRVTRR